MQNPEGVLNDHVVAANTSSLATVRLIWNYNLADLAPDFPLSVDHRSIFQEGQFEAYRTPGQHMAQSALDYIPVQTDNSPYQPPTEAARAANSDQDISCPDFQQWFVNMETP